MHHSLVLSPHFCRADPHTFAPEIVGIKAYGLFQLPPEWTVPFLVVTVSAFRLESPSAEACDHTQDEGMPSLNRGELETLLGELRDLGYPRVIVRSSSASETLEDRGLYQSYVCLTDLQQVLANVRRIREQARLLATVHSRSELSHMAVVIQGYVRPLVSGHLSNERRVSRKITDWTCEREVHGTGEMKTYRFRADSGDASEESAPIFCDSLTELQTGMGNVAGRYAREERRVHLEWLWSGSRIWIVQLDDEPPVAATTAPGKPPDSWRVTPLPQKLTRLRPASDADRAWRKVDCVRVFQECGLPFGAVFLLEGAEQLEPLMKGRPDDGLRNDLARLLEVPIVIRTDVDRTTQRPGLLLPRTDAISSVPAALEFLASTVRSLSQQGIQLSQLGFLIHRLIPATSGAYAFAKPSVPRVRIDCLWGSPDGLSYYAHDSFDVDTRSRRVLGRRVRCKTHYIDLDEDGRWNEKRNGKPWDWNASATDEDLFTMAENSRTIAERVGRAVAVMFFVGVDPRTGLPRCLPWFFTQEVISEFDQEDAHIRFVGNRFLVTCETDLRVFEKRVQQAKGGQRIGIRLRPRPDLLRSSEFLRQVADVSNRTGAAVELEGSILSHAYYVLRRHGVRLRCIDLFQESPDRQEFGKLVRDRIPLRIESHGEEPRTYKVTREDLLSLLKAKAVEEALEVFWQADEEKTLGELADLLEVVESTCRLMGRSTDQLRDFADQKRQERGGFDKGIVLVETRAVPLIRREPLEHTFFEDAALEGFPPSSPAPSMRQRISESRKPRLEGADATIPLVPPEPVSGSKPYILPLPDGQRELVISYEKSAVRVTVRSVREMKHGDSEQLWFPFSEGDP